MSNLTTRKIVLGMLMTLVLAFGVQGTADAVKDPKLKQSATDIAKFRTPNEPFSIRVPLPFDNAGTEESVTITFSAGITPTGMFHDVTLSNLGAFTLAEKGDRAAVAANPNADPPVKAVTAANGSEFLFDTDRETNSTTITIQGRFNNDGTGRQTVLIEGEDFDGADAGTWNYTYIYHVTPANGASTDTISGGLLGINDGYAVGDFGDADQQIYNGSGNLPVLYTPRNRLVMGHDDLGSERISVPSGPISSVFDVYLKQNTTTDMMTATVRGSNSSTVGVYIYGYPTLEVDAPTGRDKGSMDNPGKPGEVIQNAFTATVKDEKGSGVPGIVVTFDKTTDSGSGLIFSGNSGTLVTSGNALIRDTNTNQIITDGERDPQYVRTDSRGKASIDFRLGKAGTQTVTVSAGRSGDATFRDRMQNVNAYAGSAAGKQLSVFKIVSVPDSPNTFDLFASVTNNGEKLKIGTASTDDIDPGDTLGANDYDIAFRTDDGTLTNTPDEQTDTDETSNTNLPQVIERPNEDSIAVVRFKWDGSSSNPQVTASIEESIGDVKRPVQTVTFDINRPAVDRPDRDDDDDDDDEEDDATTTITVSPLILRGETNAVVQLGVRAGTTTIPVTVTGNAAFISAGGIVSETGVIRDVRLPNTAGTGIYSLTVSARGYADRTIPVTVTATAPTGLGTLTVSKDGAQIGTQQQVLVSASPAPSSTLVFTVTSGGFRVGGGEITTAGSGRAIITVPAASGLYTLTVSATGYTPRQVTFTAGAQTTTTTTTTPTDPTIPIEEPPAAEPSSIEIGGQATRSGTVNEELAAPLLVRVLDDDNAGVEDARVIFRVISGRGRLSQRGNGRAIGVQTDSRGYARADFTPLDGGRITVRASTDDISATVTFTITSDDGTPVDDGPADTGEPRSTERTPVVHVGAASRPPMLWVEEGAIYALVGASPQKFAPSVDNALNIAVGGGKVYWTEKTGESSGTINSANLDGSDVTELVSVRSVPMGIAVDTAGSKLYWTASSGKIKRANLNGSGSENVVPGGLESPMDLALADGNVYWTQGNGSVRFASLTGQTRSRPISTGSDTPGSLAIGGGKVYWTEKTAASAGTINSANLNGTGVRELTSIRSVPMGIAVDTARSKLYWTASSGKVKQANLNGSGAKNVVSGLGSPSDMVLSNSITAPAATTTTTTTTASNAKYDVNGDGTVDRFDALLVVSAFGTSNNKYDVNGDGTVDVKDYDLVFDNLAPGAAAAPAIVGVKFSAAQIDRIEEQIDLLIATNDRSPAAMRTLIYLQQLIVTARPEKTQLLANYPNPFNPETWIPYELATDTNVRITIYNTQGVVIRTLEFGHQSAGYYVGRDRAAYWDGRNALGEQVASGLYFYQLETDEMSSMRKMVILK